MIPPTKMKNGYRAAATDEERGREAAKWVENLAGDTANEPGQDAAPRRGVTGPV